MTEIQFCHYKMKTPDGSRRVSVVISPMSKGLAKPLRLFEHAIFSGPALPFGLRPAPPGWDTATHGADTVLLAAVVR
jgi:hypothetical protein